MSARDDYPSDTCRAEFPLIHTDEGAYCTVDTWALACNEIDRLRDGIQMAHAVIELVDEKAALEAEVVTLRAGITDASNALREQQPPVRIEYRVLNALDDLRRALRAGAT